MASSAALIKLCAVAVICIVMAAPHVDAAVTCNQVKSYLSPCVSYLQGEGDSPPDACCTGLKNLKKKAVTTADKRTACKCIKEAVAGIPGFMDSRAQGLPGKCKVSIPYKISRSTNCDQVN